MVVDGRIEIPDELDAVGVATVAASYAVVLIVGIGVAIKYKCWAQSHTNLFLAGRSLGYGLGIFTVTGTWIGGGIVHLSAGRVYNQEDGFLWVHAPIAFAFSLPIGALLFASKIKKDFGCVTVLDPIEKRYGRVMTVLIAIPLIASQIFWAAATLSALNVLLSVALGVENVGALILSLFVVYIYITIGGQYSVVFTDVLQVIFISFGTWLAFGYAVNHEAVTSLKENAHDWIGLGNVVADERIGRYVDSTLRYLFAGTVFQIYIQRVLCGHSVRAAQIVSVLGTVITLILVIPGILIGAVARSTDFDKTAFNGTVPSPSEKSDFRFVLPLVVKALTPRWTSVLVLALLAGASLASADASVVSSAFLFTNNVYATLRHRRSRAYPQSTEMVLVTRLGMAIVLIGALMLVLFVRPIYDIWSFSVSLVYILVFPQIMVALYVKFSNGFGSMCAFTVGIVLAFLSGDDSIGLPAVIKYPFFDELKNRQNFPWKTMLVIISVIIHIVISALTSLWVKQGCMAECCDALGSKELDEKQRMGNQYVPPI